MQVIPYFYPAWRFGGPVRVVYDISRKLVERGHSVTVYTSDILEENTRVTDFYRNIEGVEVFYFKNLSLQAARRRLYVTPSLVTAVKSNIKSFDVVHIHGNRTSQTPILYHFLKKYSIPYLVQAHGGLPNIIGHRLKYIYDLLFGYPLLRDASKVIALSETEQQQYLSLGIPKLNIVIIPNGLDLTAYTRLPAKGLFKKKFGVAESDKIVLYMGRINKIKGVDFLIRSFANYAKNNGHLKLVIAGPDDGYVTTAKAIVNSLSISDLVLFTGTLSETDRVAAYVDSTICAYLGQFEPFGIVTLEAAACGTPVIVSRGTPMSNIVDEGKFGLSVTYGDIHELAEAMRRLLTDHDLLEEMSQRGHKFIFENYKWNQIAALEKVYAVTININATKHQKC